MSFLEELQLRISNSECTVVLPETDQGKILLAAERIVEKKIAIPVLLGKEETIQELAYNLKVNLSGAQFIDYEDEEIICDLIQKYLSVNNQFSEKALRRKMKNPLNFAAIAVAVGMFDCLAAGVHYSTGEVILTAQSLIGTQENIETISSIGLVEIPAYNGDDNRMFAIADCAVNPLPSTHQLSDIAITSAQTVEKLLGWNAKVAMLSFSTKGSSTHETVDKVIEAVSIAKEKKPDLKVDGEFQLDAALVPEVAKKKVPGDSEVAGKANVLIFPDLGSGNIAVKLLQIFAHAKAHGPLLQGFKRPVTDFSRSASVDEIIGNITMLVVLSGK